MEKIDKMFQFVVDCGRMEELEESAKNAPGGPWLICICHLKDKTGRNFAKRYDKAFAPQSNHTVWTFLYEKRAFLREFSSFKSAPDFTGVMIGYGTIKMFSRGQIHIPSVPSAATAVPVKHGKGFTFN